MLKTTEFVPLWMGLAISGGLVGCSGNDSSTVIGAAPVINPIEVDKTIATVDWDQNNEVEMASHAYRSIARNSMLATLYSGQSAIFTSFISLVQGSRDKNCNSSGFIDAVLADAECKNMSNEVVDCSIEEGGKTVANSAVVITTVDQSAIFYQCQDGITSGSYFDGPLRVVLKDDFSVSGVYKNTTTVSALAEVSQQGENGQFVLNADNEIVKIQATDFLMQNEINTFFLSHEYDLTTEYDTSSDRLTSRNISECTTADEIVDDVIVKQGTSIVTQELLAASFASGLQQPSPQFSYAEFSNLNLIGAKNNFRCEDLDENTENGNESLRYDTSYSLTIDKIESKALGKNTALNWTDLVIPTDQKNIEGTITLTHINQNPIVSNYVVLAVFDKAGNVTVNDGPPMTVQGFLDLSKVEEVVAE
jgi:hypothetical protein